MSYIYKASAMILLITLCGCTTMWQDINQSDTEHAVSSSLMDYLYPDQGITPQGLKKTDQQHLQLPPIKPAPSFWSNNTEQYRKANISTPIPSLVNSRNYTFNTINQPLRIGLAFIPTKGEIPGLSEARKVLLLQNVKQKFEHYPYIQHVQIIPKIHFRSGTGFEHIERMGKIYQLDAIALVSYDQIVHTDDNSLAFLYLTIVGAYIVPGSEYDTQTFVDTAIFDIRSKKLLLRATGVDNSTTLTTLVGSVKKKRNTRYQSFDNAFQQMVADLDTEMSRIKSK